MSSRKSALWVSEICDLNFFVSKKVWMLACEDFNLFLCIFCKGLQWWNRHHNFQNDSDRKRKKKMIPMLTNHDKGGSGYWIPFIINGQQSPRRTQVRSTKTVQLRRRKKNRQQSTVVVYLSCWQHPPTYLGLYRKLQMSTTPPLLHLSPIALS